MNGKEDLNLSNLIVGSGLSLLVSLSLATIISLFNLNNNMIRLNTKFEIAFTQIGDLNARVRELEKR
jgi:hypothetical protein